LKPIAVNDTAKKNIHGLKDNSFPYHITIYASNDQAYGKLSGKND
jgi:hypothetical protein